MTHTCSCFLIDRSQQHRQQVILLFFALVTLVNDIGCYFIYCTNGFPQPTMRRCWKDQGRERKANICCEILTYLCKRIGLGAHVTAKKGLTHNTQYQLCHLLHDIEGLAFCREHLPTLQHLKYGIGHQCSKSRDTLVMKCRLHEATLYKPLASSHGGKAIT